MTPARRAVLLKRWALEEGFDDAGVASVEPVDDGGFFARWLERGDHAGMDYMERGLDRRLEPARNLDGARSVLCVALRYAPLAGQTGETGEPEPEGDLWPRVARYARGDDYHDLMESRLERLGERIRRHYPTCETRRSVDTAPVLERELARRAGLGAVGKNTCLLNREAGSYFLLGELFLTLELAPDESLTDMCGSCTLCLEACPTDALRSPYRLDSNRCISYWTIEHRGPVPEEARELLDDWVFGCDVCQEVCPWNRRPLEPAERPEMRLPEGRRELTLTDLLGISRDEYLERFRGSPMKRAGRQGLRRNAAVAMGNRGDRRYEPALRQAAEDDDPVVSSHAAWALERLERLDHP